jgi:LPS biosynthesis protein
MNELQIIELDILKQFIYICNKYKLTYYAIGGTLLGAVRHKGFIPWDDDIDVGMPRKDYETFVNIANVELPQHYFLQTFQSDSEYPHNYAKIRNSNTTYIENAVNNLKMNHGIYIDIFPLDGIKKNLIFKIRKKIKFSLCNINITRAFCFDNKLSFKGKVLLKISDLVFPNIKAAIESKEKFMKKYPLEKCSYIVNYCGNWGDREIVPKDYMGLPRKLHFEDIEINVPDKYDEYLTNIYGDYLTLPPVEKQIGHHDTKYCDLYKSYLHYTKY